MTVTDKPGPREWFRITNKADARSAEVDILDEIGSWYGVTAKDFAAQLSALDVDDIHLRINSPGGDVFDGVAIMNTLRQHKAKVHADVVGIAASAASFIAVGGADDVHMSAGSMLMVHDASGLVWGNAQDMHETATVLDTISDNIAAIYAGKAGGSTREWRDIMRAETWYTAADAVDAGLADEAETADQGGPSDSLRGRVMASAARQRGHTIDEARAAAAALGAITPTNKLPASPGQENPPTQEDTMSDALMAGLRDRLGIAADAVVTEESVLDALDEALTAPPTNALPENVVPVDKAVYDTMQAELAAGRAAVAEATAARRDGILNAALAAGKITAASAELWRAQLETSEDGTAALLASMPTNTVPVEMVGHTGGIDEAADEDAQLFIKAWGASPAVEGK